MSDRRQSLLDAALELVGEGGLDAVTIAALTERSGMSNGSIYHHFGSRAGVFAQLYADSYGRCVAAMLPALRAGSAEEGVRGLTLSYLDWVMANPSRARFLYAAPDHADPAAKMAEFAPVLAWFLDRMASGELRTVPPWALEPVAMGPAHESVRRFLLGVFDLAQAREIVADAVWAVLKP
ncbi:TetR/AcrR family transcriptional regulator [Lentzea flaviverrucosa]|uniref:Transcriptional regulator, TetR family n=1 Tax=Lentzea flaviverrucosa TaxID=200379 RepID=A0A1H9K363_9PSEU|nr:TetR/AcrR family transcriptional regulator [Lentzea flaviverrucosa]RDI26729.1 TetR family transcriptional regulator [Lentzea flaviverrucosa]SEQ93636.1 transcriptional regulator, TetR family [Lentzea flaviverrucosa]